MQQDQIKISCDLSGGPGASWTVELEFIRIPSGFAVWGTEGDPAGQLGKKTKLSDVSHPLNWREVCRFLMAHKHLCVNGDSTTIIYISGVRGYEADIISSAFNIDEDSTLDRHLIVRLLIGFSDEELKALVQKWGTPVNPNLIEAEDLDKRDPYEFIESLANYAEGRGFLGNTLSSIAQSVQVDLSEVTNIEKISRRLIEQKQNGLFEQLVAYAKSKEISENNIRKIICTDQFSLLYQQLITTGTPQDSHILGLLEMLVILNSEPRLTANNQTGFWAALVWLAGTPTGVEHAFAECAKKSMDKATEMATFILSLGKECASIFEPDHRWTGGPYGAAMARANAMQKLGVVMRCQRVSEALSLPLPQDLLIDESKVMSND